MKENQHFYSGMNWQEKKCARRKDWRCVCTIPQNQQWEEGPMEDWKIPHDDEFPQISPQSWSQHQYQQFEEEGHQLPSDVSAGLVTQGLRSLGI